MAKKYTKCAAWLSRGNHISRDFGAAVAGAQHLDRAAAAHVRRGRDIASARFERTAIKKTWTYQDSGANELNVGSHERVDRYCRQLTAFGQNVDLFSEMKSTVLSSNVKTKWRSRGYVYGLCRG
jgi:hypothetical protein